ncbi:MULTISPECIES: acyl carrier protein [Streptomyces]|uniref:Acyl carrier protein n=1 Tax=Streptomyces buecherae TaxID=2763006 RepID=A0A7H8N657_9ACTN|nr:MULTISPECIES: acyl carrier protein [Streptomyces]QKW49984.1 acyl carrier protein [Streptomyces buecherae]WEV27732.1 acyl carrier protein [Streptomyces sp. 71268]
MNESDIRTGVREVFAQVLATSPEQVPVDADLYDDLGADSLNKLEVIAHVEARFGCRLTDDEAALGNSVDSLARYVGGHVG